MSGDNARTPIAGTSVPVANGDNQNLIWSRSIVESIRKSRDGADANFSALDVSCERMLCDKSKRTAHLLEQSTP
jgi:hypothetical protein